MEVYIQPNNGRDGSLSKDLCAGNRFFQIADVDERSVEGKLNGGGIPVKVSGSGGKVQMSFR